MATVLPIRISCTVIDANALIALCAKEPGRYLLAQAEITASARNGGLFYAPNIIVGETLYALRRKLTDAVLTPAEHLQAVQSLSIRIAAILPPPNGESSLIRRANQICDGCGASRSADAIHIALAEELSQTYATRLLTFDRGIPNQAARNAPTVNVHLLT